MTIIFIRAAFPHRLRQHGKWVSNGLSTLKNEISIYFCSFFSRLEDCLQL